MRRRGSARAQTDRATRQRGAPCSRDDAHGQDIGTPASPSTTPRTWVRRLGRARGPTQIGRPGTWGRPRRTPTHTGRIRHRRFHLAMFRLANAGEAARQSCGPPTLIGPPYGMRRARGAARTDRTRHRCFRSAKLSIRELRRQPQDDRSVGLGSRGKGSCRRRHTRGARGQRHVRRDSQPSTPVRGRTAPADCLRVRLRAGAEDPSTHSSRARSGRRRFT